MVQAGVYSATRHYLKAVKAIGATDPERVMEKMRETPINDFMTKNGMIWPQYWDRDHRMGAIYKVTAIPTYVLIDAEGIERMRVKGAGFHEARALSAEIEKQITLLTRSLQSAPQR